MGHSDMAGFLQIGDKKFLSTTRDGRPLRNYVSLILRDYSDGMHMAIMAAKYNLAHRTITKIVRASGQPVRQCAANYVGRSTAFLTQIGNGLFHKSMAGNKPFDKFVSDIIADYNAGMTNHVMARKHKVSRQTITKIVRESGGPVRMRGGRQASYAGKRCHRQI